MHIVALAQRAIGLDHELRANEQTDALHALGRALHAGQRQVHDVFGHVVLTVGDVDFGAKNFVSPIGLGFGAGAHQGQVGTGLGLGQVHGAGPLARNHFGDVERLLLRCAGGEQRFNGAVGEQWAQRKAEVGGVEHFATGRANGLGQALATKVGGVLQALPAALSVLLKSLFKTWGGGHDTLFEKRWVFVALPVQR